MILHLSNYIIKFKKNNVNNQGGQSFIWLKTNQEGQTKLVENKGSF